MERLEPSTVLVGRQNSCYFVNNLEVPQTIKHNTELSQNNAIPKYIPKRMETCSKKLVQECLQQQNSQWPESLDNQMCTNRRMNKQNVVDPVQQYTIQIKQNEVLIAASTWVNLDNLRKHQRSQAQKTTNYMTHSYEQVHNWESYRDRDQWLLRARVRRWGKGEGR